MPNPPIERRARLFRNGRNQALRIPREFELPGDEVTVHQLATLGWTVIDQEQGGSEGGAYPLTR